MYETQYNVLKNSHRHKWVFQNKLDENKIIIKNKSRLVAKEYNQEEGINYEDTYASLACHESIRCILTFACWVDLNLCQMDVKFAFLNGFINEDVYIFQHSSFEDPDNPEHVFKLKRPLYDLNKLLALIMSVLVVSYKRKD